MAERTDKRVIGWGQASVGLALWPPKENGERTKVANEMVANGHAQDFLPNFRLSAGTFLDYQHTPDDIYDFFGIEYTKPAVTRVHSPLLAFYGSNDVGSAPDLERMRTLIARSGGGPAHITTAIIQNADHDYSGRELEVARLLGNWISGLSPTNLE